MKIKVPICIAIIMLIVPQSVLSETNSVELINKWLKDHMHELIAHREVPSDKAWEINTVVAADLNKNNEFTIIFQEVANNEAGHVWPIEASVSEFTFNLKKVESLEIMLPRPIYFKASVPFKSKCIFL